MRYNKNKSIKNPYQYTGRRYHEETGQYYYRARMYSVEQCRFTSEDPAGMVDGPNMYAYVGNNPVNKRDPSGKYAPQDVIDGGGGGGDEYDYGYCPCDYRWSDVYSCVDYMYAHQYPDPYEMCESICWESCNADWDIGDTEAYDFFVCLGIEGNLEIIGCILSGLGVIGGGLTGVGLFWSAVTIGSAAISCGVAAHAVDQCT